MKNQPLLYLGLVLAIWVSACQNTASNYQQKAANPEFLHAGFKRITDIIRHDIFAPPVSSRIYAYSAVAAYEALAPGYPN